MGKRLLSWINTPFNRGLLLTLAFITLHLSPPAVIDDLFSRLDQLIYDIRFNAALEEHSSEHKIVVIDLDEKSLAAEGRWPWSRAKVAQLLEQLANYGTAVVAFDILFSEPERNIVSELLAQPPIQSTSTELQAQLQALESSVDFDAEFASHLGDTDVVLGYSFFATDSRQGGQLPPSLIELTPDQQQRLVMPPMLGYTANLSILQDAAISGGAFTTMPDQDGSLRRSPLLFRFGDQLYPSLGLEAARLYLFEENVQLVTGQVSASTETVVGIQLGGSFIPTDAVARATVPYIGGQKSYPYLPATDVLNGRITSDVLEDSIVLIGTSAIGLKDLRTTPVGTSYPGVEVHANIIDGILSNQFPSRPDWEPGATASIMLLFGILLALLLPRLGPVWLVSLGLGSVVAVIGFNFYLWQAQQYDLPLASQVILLVLLTSLFLTEGFLRENNQRKQIKGMFNQYVPPAHIDAMLSDPENYTFDGETKVITVLFSDIRSFTNISEKLSAGELKQMLNRYFTPITKVIFDQEGTIDKYVGDMVMAFWGAPLDDAKQKEHAIEAALQMLETTEQLKKEFAEIGLPEVNIGIGINTGRMNVGDMGSTYRRAYTVLGDAVNLGARLESITKAYGSRLIVSENTCKDVTDFLFRCIDRIQVKGKEEPIDIYEPIVRTRDATQAQHLAIKRFTEAREMYINQQWDEAKAAFETLMAQAYDRPAEIYLERIETLRDQDLPTDWDGTFRHTSK